MKKIYLMGVLVILGSVLLSGCKNNSTEQMFDSSVNYEISVPKSTEENQYEVFLSAPFYRVYNEKNQWKEFLETKNQFSIGEEVILEGQNVSALEGGTLSVYQMKLEDAVDKDTFCQRILAFYQPEESIDILSESGAKTETEKDKVLKTIKKEFSDVKDEYNILLFEFVFSGIVKEDIIIEGFSIPQMTLEMEFDNFEINTVEVGDIIIDDYESVIEYSSFGGMFADAAISEMGYFSIEGDVVSDIRSIEVFSLNDVAEVVTDDNYEEYEALEEEYGTLYMTQKETDYSVGDRLSLNYSYIFNSEKLCINESDAVMASIGIKTTTTDDREIWNFIYQPSVVDGPYLILPLIEEKLQ